MRKSIRKIVTASIKVGVILAILAILMYKRIIWPNDLFSKKYSVRGVDVSSYQGDIDWETLSKQNIDFAFIKATEGSGYEDPCFKQNWEEAMQTDLRIGAYHFFSFDSAGKTQAENFIKTVPKDPNSLPPVVDFEFYGDKKQNIPAKAEAYAILDELLKELEAYYGKKPIIYATQTTYKLYIQGVYDDYPLWIRDIVKMPMLKKGAKWTFWQYNDGEILEGYKGEEKHIDMNVFRGDKQALADL